MRPRPENREPFIHSVELVSERVANFDLFPFNIPAARLLGNLKLHPAVTFLIGENGSGKSTIARGHRRPNGLLGAWRRPCPEFLPA
jgi:ABC-type siderophore export system fused ATPase/permease subunit